MVQRNWQSEQPPTTPHQAMQRRAEEEQKLESLSRLTSTFLEDDEDSFRQLADDEGDGAGDGTAASGAAAASAMQRSLSPTAAARGKRGSAPATMTPPAGNGTRRSLPRGRYQSAGAVPQMERVSPSQRASSHNIVSSAAGPETPIAGVRAPPRTPSSSSSRPSRWGSLKSAVKSPSSGSLFGGRNRKHTHF